MIDMVIDKSGLAQLAARFPKAHKVALVAALRSESYRLAGLIKDYGRSQGEGKWSYAPVTKYLRKSGGYGRWLARYTRYFVDDENLTAWAGMISRQVGGKKDLKFEPISRGFAASAVRLSSGFYLTISGRQQRAIAKRLLRPDSRQFSRFKTAAGAQRRWNTLAGVIPRAGVRRVAARPFVEPVLQRERQRSLRNVQALYLTRIMGGRWKSSWARDWGNSG